MAGCAEEAEISEPELVFFDLDDSDNTNIDLYIEELGSEEHVPFNLVAAVGYIDNHDEDEGGILLTMLPYDSRGDIFEPGPGWLQIKINNEQDSGLLNSRVSEHETFLIFENMPDHGTFKALYFDEDTNSVSVSGQIDLVGIDFSIEDGFSTLDLDMEVPELEVNDTESPYTLSGNISYSGIGGDYGESDSGSDEEGKDSGSDVPGGCGSYNGPEGDPQWQTLCQAAYQYACANQADAVEATCQNFRGLQEAFPGIPDCPYCNY